MNLLTVILSVLLVLLPGVPLVLTWYRALVSRGETVPLSRRDFTLVLPLVVATLSFFTVCSGIALSTSHRLRLRPSEISNDLPELGDSPADGHHSSFWQTRARTESTGGSVGRSCGTSVALPGSGQFDSLTP